MGAGEWWWWRVESVWHMTDNFLLSNIPGPCDKVSEYQVAIHLQGFLNGPSTQRSLTCHRGLSPNACQRSLAPHLSNRSLAQRLSERFLLPHTCQRGLWPPTCQRGLSPHTCQRGLSLQTVPFLSQEEEEEEKGGEALSDDNQPVRLAEVI